jgi:creatinine amidohydrolase
MLAMKNYLHGLTYEEARNYFSSRNIVILPVGSVEQHGPANPLGTDTLIADALAREASIRTGVVSLPIVPFGVSFHHMDYPGTITVSERALEAYLFDVIASLKRWGVKKVLIINGHGGNLPALQILARRAREELGVKVFIYQWWTSSSRILSELFDERERGHAGAAETSLNMYLHPSLVRSDKVVDEAPRTNESLSGLTTFLYTSEQTKSGVFGVQTSASADRGKELFERLVEDLVRIIEELERTE